MSRAELHYYPIESFDPDDDLVIFSMREIEVDGIPGQRWNSQGDLTISPNAMFTLKGDGYEPVVDTEGNVYYEFNSPYMFVDGDPIDEEAWLKRGIIKTVNGDWL